MAIPSKSVAFPVWRSGSTATVDARLPLRIIAFSGCTIDERWCSADLTSPHWRLYLNLDDGAEALVHGRRHAFTAGNIYLIPAWLPWSSQCRGKVRHLNALIDLPALGRERISENCNTIALIAQIQDPLAQDGMNLAANLAASPHADPTLQARGHAFVWSVFARYFAALGSAADELLPVHEGPDLSHLQAWVDLHLQHPLSRASLAKAANLSETALARHFHKTLGLTPALWLRQRRLTLAAELLKSTSLSLEEIALRSGLVDRTHLSRTFRKLLSCSPSDYRRRSQGQMG